MIPDPIIYDQNEGQISHDLLPINRRKPKFLSWFLTLLKSLQWDHDLIFTDYAYGVMFPLWDGSVTYVYGDRVIYIDNAVYEMQNTAGLISAVSPNLDNTNWTKILDIFIGVRERARYNGDKLILEFALNRYFMVSPFSAMEWGVSWSGGVPTAESTPPYTQIYISNTNNAASNFWLSDGGVGALTSYMSAGFGQKYFLGNSYSTYSPFAFNIYVPTAVYAQIEANQVPGSGITGEDVIRSVADKYVQAGKLYSVIQY